MKHIGMMLLIIVVFLGGCAPASRQMTPLPAMHEEETVTPEKNLFPAGYLRVNQLGYSPDGPKAAYFLTRQAITNESFQLVDENNAAPVMDITQIMDQGQYGSFDHLYVLDFSDWQKSGTFSIRVGEVQSYPFEINTGLYQPLVGQSLKFFKVQHCGDTAPEGHGVCHLDDGVIVGGALDGTSMDAGGGWHDAGDYIKYSITTGYSTLLLLHAVDINPESKDAQAVFDEAQIGLNWLEKLWDAENQVLYYQVSDDADHEEWRMPEDDTLNPRPVYACEAGKGANIAGKSAAAMALAGRLYEDASADWYDAERAQQLLEQAKSLYEFGKQNPEAQPSNPADFYEEETSNDDMALAAVMLYAATKEENYAEDAKTWLTSLEAGNGFYWGEMGSLAYYYAARENLTSAEEAGAFLQADLQPAADLSAQRAFATGIAEFHWGSAETMANLALEAMWYERITGDTGYRIMAMHQLDYILGANPWGVCWVSGVGSNWPKKPHHQIADLTQSDLPGFWDEGAVPLSVFEEDGPEALLEADEYAEFQSEEAVYHDDTEDWVTNEPTITMNAAGLALSAWMGMQE